ncbi:inheritance of peroxisomes protein 1 domain containing protein [Rhypophila sp. PSN 637]
MESSRASGPPFPPPRRVFTVPTSSSSSQPATSSQSSNGGVEILYDHPSVKIVAFTAGSRHFSVGSGLSQPPDVAPGSLSWSSQLERTIAVGQFRIYRAPGSVAFLNCGSALQPILPKSQAWCVDESSSKFILQIRRPQYWRIEVPVANDEEIQRAQLLRQVFDTILQFEKTECPFMRSFTVALPERPQTPVKKRPWTPAQRPFLPALPPTPNHTPVELAKVRRDVPKLEPIVIPETQELSFDSGKASDQDEEAQVSPKTVPSLTGASSSDAESESNEHEIQSPTDADDESQALSKPLRLGATFPALRSVTAPPQLTLHASPPSKVREEGRSEPQRNVSRSQSPTDSQRSFHSVKSWTASSLPPSPPLSNPASPLGLSCPTEVAGGALDQEDPPELASISNGSPTWSAGPNSECDSSVTAPSSINDAAETSSTSSEMVVEEDRPKTPDPTEEAPVDACSSAVSSSPLSETASEVICRRPSIRRRGTTSSSISPSRRALSPLPPAANLFAPRKPPLRSQPSMSKLAVVRRLPMAIIQTTCEILMSPPSHLINLMLKVAARITAGEWRGFVFGTDEYGEQIPVHWDWSDDEDNARSLAYPGLRKNSLGWLPSTSQKMAGTFPESDDEESDHYESEMTKTVSNELFKSKEIDRMGDHLHEPPSPKTRLDNTSESLGVD